MAQVTLSLKATPLEAPPFRETLRAADFEFSELPYAFWRARGPGCVVTFYQSGKVVLQGPSSYATAAVLGLDAPEPEDGEPFEAALAKHPDPKPEAWVGSDEVGKGDYFGPLVVAAVRLAREQVPLIAELGAADSKRLTDKKMMEMARELKHAVTVRLVVVGPERYNRLHAEMGNLNELMAWAHARAIGEVLEAAPAPYVLVDRFADESLVRRRLRPGRRFTLAQRPRAEDDPAVAVASILARNEFLWRMRALSREAGFTLPKGAGPPVLTAGRRLVKAHGADALDHFAKRHFATTKQILGKPREKTEGPS